MDTPQNPLNTGNGDQNNLANIPAVQQIYNNPAPQPEPHPINPQELQNNPVTNESGTSGQNAPETSEPKTQNFKKYLIAAVVIIILLTGAFLAYKFFFQSDENEETTTEKTENADSNNLSNSLDNSSTETATDNPPGMVINLSGESTETSKPAETSDTAPETVENENDTTETDETIPETDETTLKINENSENVEPVTSTEENSSKIER